MTWEAVETSMTTALYSAMGQSVTYTAQDAIATTIYAIVDDGSELFGIESQTAERLTTARVKKSDIATPRRGDTITMTAGTVYVVDGITPANNVEWSLALTERDA